MHQSLRRKDPVVTLRSVYIYQLLNPHQLHHRYLALIPSTIKQLDIVINVWIPMHTCNVTIELSGLSKRKKKKKNLMSKQTIQALKISISLIQIYF